MNRARRRLAKRRRREKRVALDRAWAARWRERHGLPPLVCRADEYEPRDLLMRLWPPVCIGSVMGVGRRIEHRADDVREALRKGWILYAEYDAFPVVRVDHAETEPSPFVVVIR